MLHKQSETAHPLRQHANDSRDINHLRYRYLSVRPQRQSHDKGSRLCQFGKNRHQGFRYPVQPPVTHPFFCRLPAGLPITPGQRLFHLKNPHHIHYPACLRQKCRSRSIAPASPLLRRPYLRIEIDRQYSAHSGQRQSCRSHSHAFPQQKKHGNHQAGQEFHKGLKRIAGKDPHCPPRIISEANHLLCRNIPPAVLYGQPAQSGKESLFQGSLPINHRRVPHPGAKDDQRGKQEQTPKIHANAVDGGSGLTGGKHSNLFI